jgi:hypothetical protein
MEAQDSSAWDICNDVTKLCFSKIHAFQQFFALDPECLFMKCVFVYYYSAHFYRVVIGNKMYVTAGTPSGFEGTAIENSKDHSIMDRTCYDITVLKEHGVEVPYNKAQAPHIYSDDGIKSMNPDLHKIWNGRVLAAKVTELFGVKRTRCDKSEVDKDYEDIRECRYLQRYFKVKGSLVLAPLNQDSIVQMVQWINKPKKGVTLDQQFAINCKQALHEWAIWGEEEFNKHKRIMNAFLIAINPSLQLTETFEELWEKIAHDAMN